MRKYSFSIFLFLFFVSFTYSQNPYKAAEFTNQFNVFGKIIDAEGSEPLEYATVTILNPVDNNVVTGGITDKNGVFNIPISKGEYNILIEYISFKNYTVENLNVSENKDLGVISLIIDIESLDAVEIIAEETTVEIKLDKKIYTVGKDLTVRGGNAEDVLDNIPSVSVDLEGNILLRGNDAARILINGKPSSLVGIDSHFLQQLPSDAIEKVEVITSPSARYEARGSGGIINIILRKTKKLGLNGSLSSNIGYPERTGISSTLNYRDGKINFFNSSGFSDRVSPGTGYNYSEYYNGDQPSTFFEENRETERDRNSFFTNNGIEWYIDDKTSIVGAFFYNQAKSDDLTINNLDEIDENGNILNQTIHDENEKDIDSNREYNLNFERKFNDSGHKLTLDFQYDNSKEWEDALISKNNILNEVVSSDASSESYLIKGDYVNPIGENKQFEAGFRISQDDNITDYRVFVEDSVSGEVNFLDENQSNLFQYKEQINALYAQYGVKVEDKYSFLVGLRLENTVKDINQLTIQDFTNKNEIGLFPTFNFGLEISENETLTFGYNRRIRRPWSRSINPFPTKTSPISIYRGNPDLDPTYSNNIDFGYLKKYKSSFTINTSAYYQKATNTFNYIVEETGDTYDWGDGVEVPITERYPINLSTNTRFGFELNLSYRKGKNWNISSNFNVYSNKVEGSYNDVVYDNENVSWSFRLNNKLTLPGKIEWQTRMNVRGPSETAITKSEGDFSIDLAFSKELFKEKASLTLNVRDLLDQRGWRSETFNETFENSSEHRWRKRSFTLNFTYRFNQKKNQYRRQQQQSYDDEAMEF
jgi:outer membrane receptor protein involved in Fe transport